MFKNRYVAVTAAAVFCVASAVLLYFGITALIKKYDKRFEHVFIEKLSSEPISGMYKNRYRHVKCKNHSIEHPHYTYTKRPGPSFAKMRIHKINRTCESVDDDVVNPLLYVLLGAVFFVMMILLLWVSTLDDKNNTRKVT